MASWSQIEQAEPDFAGRVRRIFESHLHKTMATLRADGSPRISGTELTFRAGDAWVGMLRTSRKAQDLLRDPRLAVHSAPLDTKMVEGDAKVAGEAIGETDRQALSTAFGDVPPGALFWRLDVREVVLTRVGSSPQRLVVEVWDERHGLRTLSAG